jgi:predicted dehydrogenase
LRFIVIGAGFGKNHLQWLAECQGASIDALCFRENSVRALELAEQFGVPRVSDNPAQLIAEGNLDAVVVASPPDSHEELSRLGLDAGLLVVTDKPLANDLASAKRLAAQARASGQQTMVTFQWRVNPALRRLRDLAASGELGSIARADLEFHHDFLAGPSTSWPWRHQQSTAGAGTLGDQGVHLFDLLRWLMPGEWSVSCGTASVVWPQRRFNGAEVAGETEDIAEVLLSDAASSAQARVFSSRVSTGYQMVRVLLQGSKGVAVVHARPDDGSATLKAYREGADSPKTSEFGPHSMNPYQLLISESGQRQNSAELADFTDGYLAQVLLDEALTRGCGYAGNLSSNSLFSAKPS